MAVRTMIGSVRVGLAVAVVVVSAILLLLTTLVVRPRAGRGVVDACSAAGGAGLGAGALLFQGDVSALAWLLTPAALAILAVVHVRVLFGGGGPFRV